jgi:hypothetical protein
MQRVGCCIGIALGTLPRIVLPGNAIRLRPGRGGKYPAGELAMLDILDIADWPAIIGKEMPVQIRGLEPLPTPAGYDLVVRQFILETLTQTSSAADPNKTGSPKILPKCIQRAKDFCLLADVEVNGRDLAGILVENGYAKKLILPKTAAVESTTPAAV